MPALLLLGDGHGGRGRLSRCVTGLSGLLQTRTGLRSRGQLLVAGIAASLNPRIDFEAERKIVGQRLAAQACSEEEDKQKDDLVMPVKHGVTQ